MLLSFRVAALTSHVSVALGFLSRATIYAFLNLLPTINDKIPLPHPISITLLIELLRLLIYYENI